jgi:hypothetical protein
MEPLPRQTKAAAGAATRQLERLFPEADRLFLFTVEYRIETARGPNDSQSRRLQSLVRSL